ncbi:MAG TPA: YciI family protein [Chitinophagaceae bacterium]|jgi:uncharacterized protein|nr:YciI family protein [Chitinophagaceae bacterium]
MKKIIGSTVICLVLYISAFCQQEKKLENQIRQYWFVMLTAGSNRSQDSAAAARIQQDHLANINRLYNEGKLKVAGPFGDEGKWIGLFIFDCETKEEVEKLVKTDPAVAAGRLNYEIHSWWTAATGSFIPGKPAKPAQ